MDKVKCKRCGKDVSSRKNGTLRVHGPRDEEPCALSGCPVDVATAQFCTAPDAHGSPCGMIVEAGTERCGDHLSDPAPTVDSMDDTSQQSEEFESAAPPAEDEFESAEPVKKERQLVERGKYLITDPVTGQFRIYPSSGNIKGFTRVTTFVKSATDSKALNDWGKRNVAIGAAARPDLAARAYGLKNEPENRGVLDALVEELYVAANAHVPAKQGTDLHDFRERLDAGEITLDDVPPVWRRNLELYYEALERYGLVPVAGLSERVTMTHKYGGLAGKFDQVYYHVASGTYLMCDLKTGKTMDYASKEVPCQLHVYETGFNEYGVYDVESETWSRPQDDRGNLIQVRTDVGLVLHMPVQGDRKGTFRFLPAYLGEVGRPYAELCAANRAFKAPKLVEWDGTLPGAPEPVIDWTAELGDPVPDGPVDWDAEFSSVQDNDDASHAWQAAREAGITGIELNRLVGLAQQALRVKG